jgi:hypothetical protein
MDDSDNEIVIDINDKHDCNNGTMLIDDSDSEIVIDVNNYNFSTTGAAGASGSYYVSTGAGSNGSWTTNPYTFSTNNTVSTGLHVSTDAIFDKDVKIQGRSISKTLDKIEDRLAILQDPDPEKLKKFAALKKAYDNYKMLERLIGDDSNDSDKI